jgi:pimeloyl-ACP methyl ester carboxylesterase
MTRAALGLVALALTVGSTPTAPATAAARIRTELVTITAPDGAELDGAHYTSEGDARALGERKVVYLIHGRTMSFLTGLPRAVPPVLVPEGYDAFALNQRASGVIAFRDDLRGRGDARSSCADVLADVKAGLDHLTRLGYRKLILVGHSSGAFFAGHHGVREPGVEALVLASPYPFCNAIPLPRAEWDPILAQARQLVADGKGDQLILLPPSRIGFTTWAISAATALEALKSPPPPLFVALGQWKRPTLVFYGDAPLERVLQDLAKPLLGPAEGREVQSFPGTDHFYKGRIDTVTAAIKAWLLKHAPPR